MADQHKKKRSIVKGNLTRFINYFNAIKDTPIETIDFHELQRRLNDATLLLNEFTSVQELIELADDDFEANIDTHSHDRDLFENAYYKNISIVEKFLNLHLAIPEPPKFDSAHSNAEDKKQMAHMSLPKLNIPSFNGDYDQWLFFKDTFNSLIHKNESIANVDKFQFLRLSLTGIAKDTIESLEISDVNYTVAWKLLNDRFENKQILVSSHIRDLFNIPAITKESKEGLKLILNGMEKHLRALQALALPTQHWDALIIHLITVKLDSTTLREWETTKHAGELPTRKELTDFLFERCRILDALDTSQVKPAIKQQSYSSKPRSFFITSNKKCLICNKSEHNIYQCEQFKSLNAHDRLNKAKQLKLCINCLQSGHPTKQCRSGGCRKCGKIHHSLLHFYNNSGAANDTSANSHSFNSQQPESNITPSTSQTFNVNYTPNERPYVLLSTAIVTVFDFDKKPHECRILLDSGSQSNIVTERLTNMLRLPKTRVNSFIVGMGQGNLKVKHETNITLHSLANSFSCNLSCLILPEITGNIPSVSIDKRSLNIPSNITLADPTFDRVNTIDILVGADIFWDLLSVGQIKLGSGQPILQKTKLGWIVAGSTTIDKTHIPSCHVNITSDLNTQMAKFWELENYQPKTFRSEEELLAEDHYENNTTTDEEGRFIVKMPLKHPETALGDSKTMATERFIALEKRLQKSPDTKRAYNDFINEYIELGHMSECLELGVNGFYLPHHCVLKDASTTTKLRVVFDGSAKSMSGHSLNDILMTGPIIQQDLFSIIMRFRKHNVALTGDIKQMYRQILIHPDQRHLQKILWRSQPTHEIKTYTLNTVTYGLSSSSFLAIRSLHEIAKRHPSANSLVLSAILNDFYVDDLLTGCSTINEAVSLKNELTQLLQLHGFTLHKWFSNKGDTNLRNSTSVLQLGNNSETRTLGLEWNPLEDKLQYTIREPVICTKITKRSILSTIAQIFDPLGLLAPVTVTAKILIQQLWKLNLTWDESVPQDIHTTWCKYRNHLLSLNNLRVARQVTTTDYSSIQLHGFSDASEAAYGACIFVRCTHKNGFTSKLICAKTRVAPLKQITVPRLELCGALVLAELMEKVKKAINIRFDGVYYWCDSQIVLSWINTCPSRLKTFVANRTSQIQNLSNPNSWHYVNTVENPADLLSRGISPPDLLNSKLWFHGPAWLASDATHWPSIANSTDIVDMTEHRLNKILLTTKTTNDVITITKFSSLTKLNRVFAFVLRFIHNIRSPVRERRVGFVTSLELDYALKRLIHFDQRISLAAEYNALAGSRNLPNNSRLLSLNPFLDSDNIIRVGGRILQSRFHFDKKHPIVLSTTSHLTKLIVRFEHVRLLHAGPQALLASVREKYWPISGRSFIRKIVHECLTCFKLSACGERHLMGNLPITRLTPTRPFLTAGVDYAGPFLLKDRKTRNYKTIKAYIALFICFSTKAIHLELVSDLTTHCFLAALRRFFARRGICSKLYSDNGTTFIGSNNEIKRFLQGHHSDFAEALSVDKVEWKFIPPRAPHFGGLWEAGVKLVKAHIKRVISDTALTFEEFCTILTQIEACVNSRPLCPLSDDPNDLSVLTPGHFIIGEPLTSLPEPNLCEEKENRLSRFQRMQQMVQHFWARWNKEYISTLQQRSKWQQRNQQLLRIGLVVIIKEDGLPPLRWRMGRIIDLHPGADGIIRVVTVRTTSGTYKRPVVKLCVLPQQDND